MYAVPSGEKETSLLPIVDRWKLDPGYSNFVSSIYEDASKNVVEYDAYMQFKNKPPQKPIVKMFNLSKKSKIEFQGNDNTPLGDFQKEINGIVSLLKNKKVIDYSITIYGNTNGYWLMNDDFNTSSTDDYNKGFNTLGKLADGRANKIKELLVGAGLDPSKIKVERGDPQKGMSADYKITTTETQ